MPSGLGKALDQASEEIEREYPKGRELTPEQIAKGDEFMARFEAAAVKNPDGSTIYINDRDLLIEFNRWMKGEHLGWTDEFDRLFNHSLKVLNDIEARKRIEEIFEPVPGTSWGNGFNGDGILRVPYLEKVLYDWVGHDGYKSTPSGSEQVRVDRSIAYWNERGHNFRRPDQ